MIKYRVLPFMEPTRVGYYQLELVILLPVTVVIILGLLTAGNGDAKSCNSCISATKN